MKILVIGSGGREAAIVWKLAQSPRVGRLYIAPGNPGTAPYGENVSIKADDVIALRDFALNNQIDMTVVGPEIPLIEGIVDLFSESGLRIVGPNRVAAQMEGSKVFCKDILKKYAIPTASYERFEDANLAKRYVQHVGVPIVIKADGAAAGKGVTVAMTEKEAMDAISDIMEKKIFGHAGNQVVIEEMLLGQEASILAFCDGKTILPMASCQDHKRVFDGDQGPNTGGMGVFSPVPLVTDELLKDIVSTILHPTLDALKSEGIEYKGILYAGLMLTAAGPKVIEYNVRFGDPETQVILPRLTDDLVDIFEAVIDGTLDRLQPTWDEASAVCVVMAAQGYPGEYLKGKQIYGLEHFSNQSGTLVFHAGTSFENGAIVTSGGRVLNVVGRASTLQDAIRTVYRDITQLSFDGAFYRQDIAAKGLK